MLVNTLSEIMKSLQFFFPVTCLPSLLLLFPHLILSNQIDETESQNSVNTASVLADHGNLTSNMTTIPHENTVKHVKVEYNVVQNRIVNERTGRCPVKDAHNNQPPILLEMVSKL